MTFSEIGNDVDRPADKSLPELQCELTAIDDERINLCAEVENQWPGIPAYVVSYFANNCSAPEVMSFALRDVQVLSNDDPQAFDDPDIAALLLEDSLTRAEAAYVNQSRETIRDANANRLTKRDLLSKITHETAGLNGRTKLAAIRKHLKDPDIPTDIKLELTARFDQIEVVLTSMSSVFTDVDSQTEFENIVAVASFDFGAADIAGTFEPILRQVEVSSKFSAEQKYKLRNIVTGSDAQRSLNESITNENGDTVPRFTQDNKQEFRKGVSGYVEGHGRQIIEARAGAHIVTKDVTGWSGADVGFLIEATHMWNMFEGFGVTSFIEDVYKVDFSILGDGNAFDPIQIIHLRQVLSHLVGSFEGYDGDIANLTEHKTLLQNQSRLLSEMQTAFGWENDRSGTTRTLRHLGLEDDKGNPSLAVIKAFGDYTKQYFVSGTTDQAGFKQYLQRVS